VKFTLDLISELEKKYCVDPARIYSAGKSNGGGFTGLLACDSEASKRIAAFAVVSGAFYRDNKTNELPACTPGRKSVPWMEFHGYADDTIPYVGGLNTRKNAYSTNINKYVHDWARRDDFEVSSKKTSTLCSGKRSVTRYGWGKDVIVHYNYTNLGHDWPSSYENADTKADGDSVLTCKEAEATSIILEWFKKWTL
jgi:poly(3-hydroxybutyrate) depolymerase